MFAPLGWWRALFLVAVSFAAITSNLTTSVVMSLVIVGFAIWDWRRARRLSGPATTPPVVVVVDAGAPRV